MSAAPVTRPGLILRMHQRLFEWAAGQVRNEFEERTWRAFWQSAVEDKSAREVPETPGPGVGAFNMSRGRVLRRLKARVAEAMKGFRVPTEPD